MLHNFKAMNLLLNGWGVVTDENGKKIWVYVPLWDPAPMNAVGKAILATLVIKTYLPSIADEKVKTMLKAVVKDQAQIVAGGFASAMDVDGDWCGTKVPHRIPGLGPVPHGPVYFENDVVGREAFGEDFSAKLGAKAALSVLGKVLKNDAVVRAAQMIDM